VTVAIVAEVTAWQSRPLEPLYPVVFFDALRLKIRDEAAVRIKAVYLALALSGGGEEKIESVNPPHAQNPDTPSGSARRYTVGTITSPPDS